MRFKLLPLIVLMSFAACQTANEMHYFKSGDNYYRLTIREHSFASKARYLSGYFDEKAVDKYFSEMSQPDSGKFTEWVTSKSGTPGAQLVMILSTNSNSIAEQIGNLANNEVLLENIALLANKDKIEAGKVQSNELKQLRQTGQDILNVANAYFSTIDTANVGKSADISNYIKDFLANLKLKASGKISLSSLDSAITKYNSKQ